MTSKAERFKLFTDKDLNLGRVFEVKILDLRARNGVKQKSFSVLVNKGLKDDEYPTAKELRDLLESKVADLNHLQK